MWKLFNFKWDKRTLHNILKFPFIICIRVPFVLIYWAVEWLHDNMEYWSDYMPGWESK